MSLVWFGLVPVLSGCRSARPAERLGKTFYLDGAGNWGFGTHDVPAGLREAGYDGDVEIYLWTTSLMPLIDQWNIVGAKLRAQALSRRIADYLHAYPDNEVNVIALSAGTGVAIWAIEGLPDDVKVNNAVLLGSSLSSDYDVSEALSHMKGRIFVYYSAHDDVLAAVRLVGTIDGKRGVDSAGLVGLKAPPDQTHRVVNIPWNRRYMAYGWTGAHTDCTRKDFVREVIAKHVVMHQRPAVAVQIARQDRQASRRKPAAHAFVGK